MRGPRRAAREFHHFGLGDNVHGVVAHRGNRVVIAVPANVEHLHCSLVDHLACDPPQKCDNTFSEHQKQEAVDAKRFELPPKYFRFAGETWTRRFGRKSAAYCMLQNVNLALSIGALTHHAARNEVRLWILIGHVHRKTARFFNR